MKRLILISTLAASTLSAFTSSDIQLLDGNFKGPTFLDTQDGHKQTLTVQHYRTWDYGDLFMFADYAYAKKGLQFTNYKNDLYGEFSPRVSLNKIVHIPTSTGIVKEWYAAYQHNRSDTYRANLYGIGSDLNIPGFDVFGLNLYRKIQNIGNDTYQLSANYSITLSGRWHFEGFSDWTAYDFLTQDQLLFNLSPTIGLTVGKLEVGTEWHYYNENTYHQNNQVFQAMVKYSW